MAIVGGAARAAPRAAPGDKQLAEALFQDGRDLLEKGQYTEACAKFAASQRVEPKLGTLLNLATCHEHEGQTATAWAEFVEAAARAERAEDTERVAFAHEHAANLEKQLARIVIASDAEAGAALTLDGTSLEPSALGTAVPVDPGAHVLAATATGKQPWRTTFTVVAGPSETRLDIPPLVPVPRLGLDTPLPAPLSNEHASRKLPGWVAIAIGAVGIGVGSYAGIRALSLRPAAQRECPTDTCAQSGLDRWSDVRTNANVSTVAFATGLVALGVGTWLLVGGSR